MIIFAKLDILIIVNVFVSNKNKTGPSHNKVVVCYISTWAVYRPDKGQFSLDNIDPNLCTHAVYAFSGLDSPTSSIKSMGNICIY